jgi:hypothetical protein
MGFRSCSRLTLQTVSVPGTPKGWMGSGNKGGASFEFECEYLGKNSLKYGISLLLKTHTPNCFCTRDHGNIEIFCSGYRID